MVPHRHLVSLCTEVFKDKWNYLSAKFGVVRRHILYFLERFYLTKRVITFHVGCETIQGEWAVDAKKVGNRTFVLMEL